MEEHSKSDSIISSDEKDQKIIEIEPSIKIEIKIDSPIINNDIKNHKDLSEDLISKQFQSVVNVKTLQQQPESILNQQNLNETLNKNTIEKKQLNLSTEATTTIVKDVDSHSLKQSLEISPFLPASSITLSTSSEWYDLMFEHFLVVGVPPSKVAQVVPGDSVEPEILFQYPPKKPLASDKVSFFCFPKNIPISSVRRTPSGSSLNELVWGQSYLYNSQHSYIFRLNGENMILWGICITKNEFIEDLPSFIPREGSFDLGNRPSYKFAPRCYCILSNHPFFTFHFDIIRCVLGQDRIYRMTQAVTTEGQDLEKSTCLEIIKQYYATFPPKSGESTSFMFPGEPKSRTFYYPMGDGEARLIGEWVLVATFKMLSLSNLLSLFCAALLEKPIVVTSNNLSALSCVTLAVIPMLRPFVWQGILIPILPQKLNDILQAPVPFIAGVQNANLNDIEAVIFDLDRNIVTSHSIELYRFPEARKLVNNITPFHSALQSKEFKYNPVDFHNPFTTSPEELKIAQDILDTLHAYTFWLVTKIEEYYKKSTLDLSIPRNRESANHSFVESVSSLNKNFVKTFVSTQHFSVFSETLASRTKNKS